MFEPELFGGRFNVLKKVVVTFLGLFGVRAVIRLPGNCCPPYLPFVTPLIEPA